MRYFKTGNANRVYRIGKIEVRFPPTIYHGGNWIGILAIEDDKQAEAIAKHGPPIHEITQAEYAMLKKKVMTPGSVSTQLPQPPKPTEARGAEPVAASVRDEIGFTKATVSDPLEGNESKPTKSKGKKTS